GAKSALLTLSDNSSGGTQTVGLGGTGVASGPIASLSPSTLTFGSQLVSTSSAVQTLTLGNTGNAVLSISSIAVTGTNGGDFAQTNNCPITPATLAAGSNCTISFTFKPSTAGAKSALLTLSDNSSGGTQTVGLGGTGVASGPIASLSPSTLTFGSQLVSTSSAVQTLTLGNTGNAVLSISSIAVTGTNGGDFAQTNNCPITPATLAAGSNCTISFTFKPSTAGAKSALLTLSDNSSGGTQTVGLGGTGVASGPIASLSPSTLTFGSQLVSTSSAVQTLTLGNTGNAVLSISSIAVTGTNGGDFAQTNNCPITPATLAAGSNCTISFTFKPSTAGAKSALLTLSDNSSGGTQTVGLGGTGVASGPIASLSPSTLNFGSQTVNTSSAVQTLTMANTGNAGLSISSIALTGANGSDFTQTNSCPISPATLSAGATCTISITFKPSTASGESAAASVSDNFSGGTQTAVLVGMGTNVVSSAPVATLSPSTVTFANQAIGIASAAQGITLSNTGNARMTVSRISIVVAN